MARRLLKPETYRSIPERDQEQNAEVPPEIQLQGIGQAYVNASNDAAYYAKIGNQIMAHLSAGARDRIYSKQVKPLLEQLIIQ